MFRAAKTLPMAYPLLNVGPESGYMDQVPEQPTTFRSYFPETWLWELVPIGCAYINLLNIVTTFVPGKF